MIKFSFISSSPKRSEKVWISLSEIFHFQRYLGLILFGETIPDSRIFVNRVRSLIKRNGWGFAFSYLKEASRITVHFLSGKPAKPDYKGLRVKIDKVGLPKILPAVWRRNASDSVLWSRFILSSLQIFRIFPYQPRPK